MKCKFCNEVIYSPTALALHEAEVHSPHFFLTKSRKTKKTGTCPRCPYEYKSKRAYVKHHLSTHQKLLHGNSPSACKLCSGGNIYRKVSRKHFETFHKIDDSTKPQICDKCPAYFREPFQLQMHTIRIHQQDHQCEICFKCFKTRMSLVIHLNKLHPKTDESPELPHGCTFYAGCKKRFRTQAELDHHGLYGHQRPLLMGSPKTDVNLKFKFSKCEKKFRCNTYLQAHLVKVHGNRPFVCDECGKAFGCKTNFEMHLAFHKGPDKWKFQCAECGKKCASKQKLEVHERTHTKEKPFICQFCGEKYAHRHNWRGHLKTKHGNEEGVDEIIGNIKGGNYLKRKGTKKGDCIMATK